MRILIEGMDLVGKTTFAASLTAALRLRGWNANLSKGRIHSAPWHRILGLFDANKCTHSRWLNSLYLLSALADKLVIPQIPIDQIEITESYVDRAIAYGQAFKLGPLPRIAERYCSLFHSFDLAILLCCENQVRGLRFSQREARTRIDFLTIDPDIHKRFQSSYQRLMSRHKRLLEIDTSTRALKDSVAFTVELIERSLIERPPMSAQC